MSVCYQCKHDKDYCHISCTEPVRRFATCAALEKKEQKTEKPAPKGAIKEK